MARHGDRNSDVAPQGRVWLHRYAWLTAGATLVLISAGGLVTSTGAGLAVPDWPLSFGQFFPPLEGGVLYEHGHRVIAAVVGIMIVVLVGWLSLRENRPWVRRLGGAAVAALLLQALLGGITVLWGLPTAVSVLHATIAQLLFCATVVLAAALSPEIERALRPLPPAVARVTTLTTGALFLQLILGAILRHTGAGLAIPDFPLAFGRLVPPLVSEAVLIHFLHRVGALVVAGGVLWTAALIVRCRQSAFAVWPLTLLMVVLLVAQIALGALVIWTGRAVLPATAHVAAGAVLLATSLLVTLRSSGALGIPVTGGRERLSPRSPGISSERVPS